MSIEISEGLWGSLDTVSADEDFSDAFSSALFVFMILHCAYSTCFLKNCFICGSSFSLLLLLNSSCVMSSKWKTDKISLSSEA